MKIAQALRRGGGLLSMNVRLILVAFGCGRLFAIAPKRTNSEGEGVVELPSDIDQEILELVVAMNRIPGIETRLSCCGHGEWPIWVWFNFDSLEDLPRLLYWFDSCHCGFPDWRIIVSTACAMDPVLFRVEGPVGAYDQAKKIADCLNSEADGDLAAGQGRLDFIGEEVASPAETEGRVHG